MKNIIVVCLLIISSVSSVTETGTISGRVTAKNTGQALPGANIIIEGTNLGAATDTRGFFEIKNVPVGKYTIRVNLIGYETRKITAVKVKANSSTRLNIALEPSTIDKKNIVIRPNPMNIQLMKLGRSNGLLSAPTSREVFPEFNTEEYSRIVETGFLDVIKHPLSTFAADVDVASYANARRFIMQDQLPYKDVVRTEEFINYFNYDYAEPDKSRPLSINMEYSECPWNEKNKLIHIGLQGKRLQKEEQKSSNLVFLIDVSGSMKSAKKLPLLKRAFKLLVDQLKADDKITIVVYAVQRDLCYQPLVVRKKKRSRTPSKLSKPAVQRLAGLGFGWLMKWQQSTLLKAGITA